jgi:hypothetical protein
MNDLERMMEDAVKSYAAVEPSADFELRVLSRVRQLEKPRAARWGWAVGLPIAMATILAVVIMQQMRLPEPPPTIAVFPATAPDTLPRSVSSAASPNHELRELEAHAVTKRPIMTAYSHEELAALNFVQEHPEEAAQVAEMEERNTKLDTAIEIAPIQIQPITIPAIHQEDF